VVEQGVSLAGSDNSGVAAALAAAQASQQVLLFLGIGNAQEHEGIDRMNTSLPGLQEPFALQVRAPPPFFPLPSYPSPQAPREKRG